jgi:hypothetical protein
VRTLAVGAVLPPGALAAVIVLGIVDVCLAVFCIVDIVRRPAVLGGHKWLWILLVLLFTLPGSIIYLAIGREQPPAPEPARGGDLDARSRTERAADLLYGPRLTAPGASAPGRDPGISAASAPARKRERP